MATINEAMYPKPIRESGKRIPGSLGLKNRVNQGVNGFLAGFHERAQAPGADILAARRTPVKAVTANTSLNLPVADGVKSAPREQRGPAMCLSTPRRARA